MEFNQLMETFFKYPDFHMEFNLQNKEEVYNLYLTEVDKFFDIINRYYYPYILEKIEFQNLNFLDCYPEEICNSLKNLIIHSNQESNNCNFCINSLKSLEILCETFNNLPIPLRFLQVDNSRKNLKKLKLTNYANTLIVNNCFIFEQLLDSVLNNEVNSNFVINFQESRYKIHDFIAKHYKLKETINIDSHEVFMNFITFLYCVKFNYLEEQQIKETYYFSKTINFKELTEYCIRLLEEKQVNIYKDFNENELIEEYIYRSEGNISFFDENIFQKLKIETVAYIISEYKNFFCNSDLNYLNKNQFNFDILLSNGKIIPIDYCLNFIDWIKSCKYKIELTRTISELCLEKLFEYNDFSQYSENVIFSLSNAFKEKYTKQLDHFYDLDF